MLINKKKSLNFNGILEDINQPQIMGILNLTPDSFYDGGQNTSIELSINNVKKMLNDGANIIDIGAYSSRPGAEHISEQEELDRLLPTLIRLVKEIPNIKISIDTFRSNVAQESVDHGALMINDISGGDLDENMWSTVGKLNVPYVLMHMQGTPKTMQNNPNYNNLMGDIILNISEKITQIKKAGIKDIIVDPGFGFGKTISQNYEMMRNLKEFGLLGHPVLVGISRKSMIYNLLNINPKESLNGTTALHMSALDQGADFLRVHDVKQAKETIEIWRAVKFGINE